MQEKKSNTMASNPPASASASTPIDGGVSSTLSNGGWNVEFHPLLGHHVDNVEHNTCNNNEEGIFLVSIPLATLYADDKDAYRSFAPHNEGGASGSKYNATSLASKDEIKARAASVALADYTARKLSNLLPIIHSSTNDANDAVIQTMGQSKHNNASTNNAGSEKQRQRRGRKKMGNRNKKEVIVPYVLERTDCMVVQHGNLNNVGDSTILQFFLHATIPTAPLNHEKYDVAVKQKMLDEMLTPMLNQLKIQLTSVECYAHVACVVLQRMLRSMLQPPPTVGNSDGANVVGSDINEEKKADSETNNNNSDSNQQQQQQQCLNAVAFIANGSLLPRKSGRSMLPMSSPPAVPFVSPESSDQLTKDVTVDVGQFWRRFLKEDGSVADVVSQEESIMTEDASSNANNSSTVTMKGMIIPRGVTLIVGGGYHGKSTLLQALTMGVYDNTPNDGRERCVSHLDAVSIRAEDGRYVHNTNVSAFISNLPSGKSINGASISSNQDTSRFGTKDASGSTSQAANVIEAIEAGASTLLVDEDVSAANFMARDGRMRAMIMDEPITPLLYRVNGLFLAKEHQVSTVVVVGGVGEWLDVADAVVLMKDYVAYDGLAKARSVSYQFSYGHVQYAGRGVVHRLPWEVKEEKLEKLRKKMAAAVGGEEMDVEDADKSDEDDDKKSTTLSPLRRRPESNCIMSKFKDAAVHLLESGSSRLWFYRDDEENQDNESPTSCCTADDDDDEDDGMVDMSKCSQLVGNASEQLYGCGICVLWLIQESQRHPDKDLPELLDRLEHVLNRNHGGCNGGMNELMASLKQQSHVDDATAAATANDSDEKNMLLSKLLSSHDVLDLWETVGYAYRPRRHEVAMALTRMRGMRFDILPDKPKVEMDMMMMMLPEKEAKRLAEESKKRALAELWANRRKR